MILSRSPRLLLAALVLGSVGTAEVVMAQGQGGGTSAPAAPAAGVPAGDGSSFEVGGIDVDVVAKTATAARFAGWRIAARKGWQKLAQRYGRGGDLPDGALDSLISGVVVEKELIGGNRYIARLGIEFNRARAGALLGIPPEQSRSAPMLLIPIIWTGGTGQAFERKTPWLEAWMRFRAGNSSIDYVRPAGSGPDSLLMNTGQILRPGRGWWRAILGQYGASNILMPIVHIHRQWPGGPVVGTFQARYGPDNDLLGSFSLRVSNTDALPALLDAGVSRVDSIYQRALADGVIHGDPGLNFHPPAANEEATDETDSNAVAEQGVQQVSASSITVQIDTPSATSVTAAEAAMRGVPGVHSAVTTSLALGGISVMRVTYDGDVGGLAAALEARGWHVQRGNGAIRIERPTAPAPTPSAAPGGKTGG